MQVTQVTQVDTPAVILKDSAGARLKSRNWCITLNNYVQDDIDRLQKLGDNIQYVFQEEKGQSGTPHLQGLFCFPNALSFKSVKNIFGTKTHIEPTQNKCASIIYCSKAESRVGGPYSNMAKFNNNDTNDTALFKNNFKEWKKKIIKQHLENSLNDDEYIWYFSPVGDILNIKKKIND